jgi:hypothetical protein
MVTAALLVVCVVFVPVFNVGRGGDGVHGQHPQRTAGRRPFVALAIARLDDSASRGRRVVALPASRQVYLT